MEMHQEDGVAYDLIGDVHGHGAKLEALLLGLGYVPSGSSFRPPQGRKVVFLGDLIDRGPEQRRVLHIAKGMVDAGDALCLMGNHEFNAIGYLTEDPRNSGECYRPNRKDSPISMKNRQQHAAFLQQIGEGSREHKRWVDWFRTLPLWLDLGGIRAVHGSWDPSSIQRLTSAGIIPGVPLTEEQIAAVHANDASGEEDEITSARKRLTCGLEVRLPPGKAVRKDQFRFDHVRIADWRHWARSIAEVALLPPGQADLIAGWEIDTQSLTQEIAGAPLFLGHHWFSGHPKIESPLVVCLDWSAGKEGPLVAYRWDGEEELRAENLFWCPC